MSENTLKLVVRTPQRIIMERDVSSVRVLTETGQVGIRPRGEPLALAVEPGLVLVRCGEEYEFIGTAGGLLRSDRSSTKLLTPLAVVGNDESEVTEALEEVLSQPNLEIEARAILGRLQNSILNELRVSGTESAMKVEGTP